MLSKLKGEKWKTITFPEWKSLRFRYALSNFGRIVSYDKDISDGSLLKGSLTTGYRTLNLHRPGNKGTLYVHREMAKVFLKRATPKHKYVIHLDHNKLNNKLNNLKWVTTEQMIAHQQTSPVRIAYKKVQANRTVGLKLNAAQVKKIKEILKDPKRKMTVLKLAEKYKVSDMTIYRIKSGENWGRI